MFIYYYLVFLIFLILGVIMMLMGSYFLSLGLSVYLDWEIISLHSVSLCFSVIFDYMSLIFMGCVLLISSMVIYYSDKYMYDDLYKFRFLILVFLFVVSMMFMILSPNLVSILLGWDGLGIISYCLVIYFQNIKSYNAGMLTIIINRIGDVAILISISWMLNFGSWNFVYYTNIYDNFMFYVFFMIVLCSFTKSAQIPFSSWLPAAMAAPTPVSALVHSSTLVTAGVYLLIRFFPLFEFFDCGFLCLLSLMTMFMSGLGASFEFDLKKIIALSTLSQLGLMMSILFLGFPKLAFFHLLTHAFFKSLLFLCAGLIIHVMNGSQDIRDMGFVVKVLPYTSSCFFISSLSLCGMPFMSGFYSKDMIIESIFMNSFSYYYYFIFLFSVSFTVMYSVRLLNYLMVMGSNNYVCLSYYEDNNMILPMFILVGFSTFLGVVLMWIMFKTPFFFVSSLFIKFLPLISIFLGFFMGMFFSFYYMNMYNMYMNGVLSFVGCMWYMPYFSTLMVNSNFFFFSKKYMNMMDGGWSEFFFSSSHVYYIYFSSKFIFFLEMNNLKLFMISFLFFFVFL
nr:NADH dehydrogenase subunit 5 [Pilophorus typicus]